MLSTALVFAAATFLLWGANNFVMGYAEKAYDIDPEHFTAVMWMTMGVLGVIVFAYLRLTGHAIPFDGQAVFPIACGAMLGIGILTFSFATSSPDTETGATAAVATSNAVFTAILALVFLREDMSLQQWVGIRAVILGIVLLRA